MEGQWCLPLAYWETGVLGLINNLQQHYHQNTDLLLDFSICPYHVLGSDSVSVTFEFKLMFFKRQVLPRYYVR